MKRIWEVDYELNWTWWTFGVRYRAAPYSATEILIGLGQLLLVFTKAFHLD